jgi:glycerophosphoryl diester phosphodiesterase
MLKPRAAARGAVVLACALAATVLVVPAAAEAAAEAAGEAAATAIRPELRVHDARVVESVDRALARVKVSLSRAPTRKVTVRYRTVSGSAATGADFVAVSGRLVFAPGSRVRRVAVPVVGDTAPERDEGFELHLSRPKAATLAREVGTVTIHDRTPVVIAHRGASGYRPEHTLAAYRLAIRMGADYVEPDLVSTKDHVLVVRHGHELSGSTDVANHPEFAARYTTKQVSGRVETGWFTEDFTLAELKTLRAKEQNPTVRPGNTSYDGRFKIPTFEQVLRLVDKKSAELGVEIGVYPETKQPSYFDSIGLSLEEPLALALSQHGLDRKRAPVFIQSFEPGSLRDLDTMVEVPLVQLVGESGPRVTRRSLAGIARYADAVGPAKRLVLPVDASGGTGRPTDLVHDAHAEGLLVHVWTMRDENRFMARDFRRGRDPNAAGHARAEIEAFLDVGVDGVIGDYPDTAVDARDSWWEAHGRRAG